MSQKNKQAKQPKRKKFTCAEKWMIAVAITLAVALISVMILSVLVYYGVLNIGFINDIFISKGMKDPDQDAPEYVQQELQDTPTKDPTPQETQGPDLSTPYEATAPDADEYFDEVATVISTQPAKQSADATTEAQAYSNFAERGFTQEAITTEYSMDGTYSDAKKISSYSSTQHPMYQTTYFTESGDAWVIYEINGTISAFPFSYNAQEGITVPVILSETTTITSYDSTKNKFYVIEPNDSVMVVKTVERIDAQTLELLTFGEIDAL